MEEFDDIFPLGFDEDFSEFLEENLEFDDPPASTNVGVEEIEEVSFPPSKSNNLR